MAGAPANADSEAPVEAVDSLVQHKHHNHHHKYARDSYDHDPTTTSMYDDGHVYADKPGSVNWKFAGGPKAELDAAIAAKTATKPALAQHRHHHHRHGGHKGADTFDHDPDTTSMYDDQHVYSAPGAFKASANAAPKGKAGPEKDTAPASNPEAALM